MPKAIFRADSYDFEVGYEVPFHIDGFPLPELRDINMFHIEGYIPEDGDFVWLAINLGEADARALLRAKQQRLRSDFDERGGLRIGMLGGVALVGPNDEGVYGSVEMPDYKAFLQAQQEGVL